MKPKTLLVFAFIAHLLCIFPAGHAAIPLGFFEPILIMGSFSNNAESPYLWLVSASTLILGQLSLIYALTQTSVKRLYQFGFLGVSILAISIVLIYFTLDEQAMVLTLISAIPFIVVSSLLLKTSREFS